MTELELKSKLVTHLKGIVDSNIIEVQLGTVDSASKHDLVNASGCILVGSAGSSPFIPKVVPGERLHARVDYHQSIQIIITVGYLTINGNTEQHDDLVNVVLQSVTNLVNDKLVNQITPVRISETRERDGATWTQLFFIATRRLKVLNHFI